MCIKQFIFEINKCIRDAQQKGGVNFQVGNHEGAQTYKFYPHICMFVGDNQGSSANACIKQGSTFKPCRICEADRHDIHNFNQDYPYRNTAYCHALQEAGQNVFAVKVKGGVRLTQEQQHILTVCKYESLNLVPAALFHEQFNLFPDELTALKFPPDMLHTVCGGILKSWIFWTIVIVVKVGEMDSNYSSNIALLDACIAEFPSKQSMAGKTRPFPKGISEFVKSATCSGKSSKELSTSGTT